MVLASLLVPIAVVAIVLLSQSLHLPAFLAIMATVVVYGIAAGMTFQMLGNAFELHSRKEGGGRLTEADEVHPECQHYPRFHDVDSGGLSLLIDSGYLTTRPKSDDFPREASEWADSSDEAMASRAA